MTNKEKFEQVFGLYGLNLHGCEGFYCHNIPCEDCEYDDFWSKEYKEKVEKATEPSGELISRKAKEQKEKILEFFKDINFMYNDCSMLENLSDMIDELVSSIQPQKGEWIPVSERLPEDGQKVVIYTDENEEEIATFIVILGEQYFGVGRSDTYEIEEVIAWMPIEPYKEGE